MYTPTGTYHRGEVFPHNPRLVITDTEVIAQSPIRTFIAGMGDALSTWYEARTCIENKKAYNIVNSRPTETAVGLAKLCANLLYEHGENAVRFISLFQKDDKEYMKYRTSFDNILEVNILLSGLGFESGGLAASHGVAQALTVFESMDKHYMHGEMVSMGLLVMLCLEDKLDDAKQVAIWSSKVGLPINFNQLKLPEFPDDPLMSIFTETALKQWFTHNEPFPVTAEKIINAMKQAHLLGLQIEKEVGRTAFDCYH